MAANADAVAHAIVAAGSARWPALETDGDTVRLACARWPAPLSVLPEDPAETYLAIACLLDRGAALRAFETEYLAPALAAVRRRGLSSDDLAEVGQRVRVRLFVDRRADAPVILHCVGRGRLAALVRVVAVREAVRLRGQPQPTELTAERMAEPDLRGLDDARHRVAKRAFAEAAAELSARDRCLLHLHYVRDVGGARIAAMYAVHRSTAARWLESARLRLLEAFERRVRALVPDTEPRARYEAWFHSQLELSLSRILGAAA
jgi:RNA polymerase sigma-70 factor, ECF subfamily